MEVGIRLWLGFASLLLCVAPCLSDAEPVDGGFLPGTTFKDLEPHQHIPREGPYFDTSVPQNVTALVGRNATVTCRVRDLGNKSVSWIRHRDIHILTVGRYTYTSDQRFTAVIHQNTGEYVLHVQNVQKRDAGIYECQISTKPHKSYLIHLNVVDNEPLLPSPTLNDASFTDKREVPTAEILGGPDLHVEQGSTINLTCVVQYSPEPPSYIFWYHHEDVSSPNFQGLFPQRKGAVGSVTNLTCAIQTRQGVRSQQTAIFCRNASVISYDSKRGGVSVITEKGLTTTSYLLIQNAQSGDSGKYSCRPSNADMAVINVHVLNEQPAAMQTNGAPTRLSLQSWILVLLQCIFIPQLLTVFYFECNIKHVNMKAR